MRALPGLEGAVVCPQESAEGIWTSRPVPSGRVISWPDSWTAWSWLGILGLQLEAGQGWTREQTT